MTRNAERLIVNDLWVDLDGADGPVSPVRGASLEVARGERVALVGETGSGKTMLLRSIVRLIPPGLLAGLRGSITIGGTDLIQSESAAHQARGNTVGFVFQDPMTYLNPTMTIRKQIVEALRHRPQEEHEALLYDLLRSVRLPDTAEFTRRYPHELSGGQRQRVIMAIALAGEPAFLLADEPTTALDVIVQAGLLRTLNRVVTERDMGLLLVTHDLAVVAEVCDRVYVMRNGEIVESGPVETVLVHPSHEYTKTLLAGVLTMDTEPPRPTMEGSFS